MEIKKNLHEVELIGNVSVMIDNKFATNFKIIDNKRIGFRNEKLVRINNDGLYVSNGGRFTADGIKDYFLPLKNFEIKNGYINLLDSNALKGKYTLAKKYYNNIKGLFYGDVEDLIIYDNKIYYYNTISQYFNDEIRENLHSVLAPCLAQEFFNEYLKHDPNFMKIYANDLNPMDFE